MSSGAELKSTMARPAATPPAVPALAQRGRGLSRAQKAAVVIALLGEVEARPIVERFDDETMAQVASALETISTLARDELAEIAIDFMRELRANSGSFSGGEDKAREIIANLLDQNRYDQIYGTVVEEAGSDSEAGDTWSRLEQHDPAAVADYFHSLTPNIIALILRRIDVTAASEIVAHLQDDLLDPVVNHLVGDDAPDPEIYNVLAHMVDVELLNAPQSHAEEDTSHLEAVGELLSLVPPEKRDRIVAFLTSTHEGKMKSIERVMFTIESLPDILPRDVVPVIFRELGEDSMVQLLASLRASGADISDYLLGNISSRLADQYRLQLEDIDDMTTAKCEQVQRDFLISLMTLKRQNGLKIGKPEE